MCQDPKRRSHIVAYFNHSLSHATPPCGGPGNALEAEWQWQKASIRRLEITEARGQGKDTLTEKPLALRVKEVELRANNPNS